MYIQEFSLYLVRMRTLKRFNSFLTVVFDLVLKTKGSSCGCTILTGHCVLMAHYRDGGGRENRKRARDDYDGKESTSSLSQFMNPINCNVHLSPSLPKSDAPRYKKGRYFDQGSSESESTEQKLESLITRVGEKVWIMTPTTIIAANYFCSCVSMKF